MGFARRSRAVFAICAAILTPAAAAAPSAFAQGTDPEGSGGGTRIVGGQTTTIEEWPWQVAIALNPASYGGDGHDRQFCGGSLVAPNIVITAAHCAYDNPNISSNVDDSDDDFDDPANYSVITGRTTLSSGAGQEIAVANTYYPTATGVDSASGGSGTPPLYNPDTSEWDAVFLQLAGNSTSGTIKLAGPDERSLWEGGDPAVATGWGSEVFMGPKSDTLREVDIHIISDSDCGSPLVYDGDFFPETMVCAGELSGGKDTCQGDSGGPLVVPNPAGGFRLVGDTSWGFSCALPNNPGVYGRIADDPMRSKLQAGILAVAGVDVVGSRDTDPPQTEITKHPRKRIRSDKRKVRVRFKFKSDEDRSSFECKLDKRARRSCSSPRRYRVGTPEDPRKHVFKVWATDPSGNVDPTPAKFRFKVSE